MAGQKYQYYYLNFMTYVTLLYIFSASSMAISGCPQNRGSVSAIKAAYYPSWTETLSPSSIDTSLFTHVFYAFLTPSNVTYKFEISNDTAVELSSFTAAIRGADPPAKTLFSVGGEASGAKFLAMASVRSLRRAFVGSCIEVARKFGFDGVDLDWEYPESLKEMKLFGQLLKEFRSAMEKEAYSNYRPKLLLTAAVYFSADRIFSDPPYAYPTAVMTKSLDWINVMSYDYNGAWANITGPNSALFDPNSNVNTMFGLGSWIQAGMPQEKIVMGLPVYGRTWRLKDPTQSSGFGSEAVAPGPGEGSLSFADVDKLVEESGAKVVYDVDTISVYTVVGSTWISFDNALTVTTKIGFAQALGLRGYFLWALSFDKDWEISKQASKLWLHDK